MGYNAVLVFHLVWGSNRSENAISSRTRIVLFTDTCISVYVNVTNIETTKEIKIREKVRYTVDKEDELIPNHDQQTIFAFG